MEVLEFGYSLLWIAVFLLGATALLSILGIALKERRLIVASRTGFHVWFVLMVGVCATIMHGFIEGAYNNDYIFHHSEEKLPLGFKFAGLWAGLEGSLIFWTAILAGVCSIVAFQHRFSSRHPAGRRMEPWTYIVLSAVAGFFVFLCIRENVFKAMTTEEALTWAQFSKIPLGANGELLDGKGLNPQLANYWFVFHPPFLYLGLITFTAPFAFGLAALITGEVGDYWVRISRRWTLVSWIFLTSGIILGGLWAYRQLGWGGYWAWDPVENASFLPWCTATAFLHSIIVQERRDMLKGWNAFLAIFTFFLTIEATYMTRSGEVSGSVHTFGFNETLGDIFRYFKIVVAGSGLFLIFYRWRDLRGAHRLESLFSREAAFFINNLTLVAMALAVWFLSWLPTNSRDYLARSVTIDVPYYNRVMTPLFVLLLLLTALGPGLGWVKTSMRALRKNFAFPVLVSALAVVSVYAYLAFTGRITSWYEIAMPKFIDDWLRGFKESPGLFYAEGIYPTGLLLLASFLIIATVVAEVVRATRGRARVRGETALAAFTHVVTRDNRRYGGYIVHIGIATIALGITASSMFRVYEKVQLEIGTSTAVGPYVFTVASSNRSAEEYARDLSDLSSNRRKLDEIEPGKAYFLDEILIEVRERPEEAKAAHAQSAEHSTTPTAEAITVPTPTAPLLTTLKPEQRFYPKQDQWIPEVSIDRGLLEDIYVTYIHRDGDRVTIEVFINPLIQLIWVGWFIMVAGAFYAFLPTARRRVGLADG